MRTFHPLYGEVFDTAGYVRSPRYRDHLEWVRKELAAPGDPWPQGNELFRELLARLPTLRRRALRVD
jgi:hypothetical protein